MVVSDLLRALGLLLMLLSQSRLQLYVLVFLVYSIAAFFRPSAGALLPDLVPKEQLKDMNVLLTFVGQAAGFLGPALGGLILAGLGYRFALGLDALSFAISATLIFLIRIEETRSAPKVPAVGETRRVLHSLFRTSTYRLVTVSNVVVILGAGFLNALLYVYVVRELRAGSALFGLLNSTLAVGAVLGGVVSSRIRTSSVRTMTRVAMAGVALTGLCLVALGACPVVGAAVACLGMLGLGLTIYNVFSVTLLQATIPGESLGRALGFLSTITTGASLVMMGVAGIFGDSFRTAWVLLGAGMLSTFYATLSLLAIRQKDALGLGSTPMKGQGAVHETPLSK
jgi:MFS family permease